MSDRIAKTPPMDIKKKKPDQKPASPPPWEQYYSQAQANTEQDLQNRQPQPWEKQKK